MSNDAPEARSSGSIATPNVTVLNKEKENKMMPNLIFHNLPESIEKVSENHKANDYKICTRGHQ